MQKNTLQFLVLFILILALVVGYMYLTTRASSPTIEEGLDALTPTIYTNPYESTGSIYIPAEEVTPTPEE